MPAPRVYLASPATHLTASATYGEAVQFNCIYAEHTVMQSPWPANCKIGPIFNRLVSSVSFSDSA
jgi:hypothetical protein